MLQIAVSADDDVIRRAVRLHRSRMPASGRAKSARNWNGLRRRFRGRRETYRARVDKDDRVARRTRGAGGAHGQPHHRARQKNT